MSHKTLLKHRKSLLCTGKISSDFLGMFCLEMSCLSVQFVHFHTHIQLLSQPERVQTCFQVR